MKIKDYFNVQYTRYSLIAFMLTLLALASFGMMIIARADGIFEEIAFSVLFVSTASCVYWPMFDEKSKRYICTQINEDITLTEFDIQHNLNEEYVKYLDYTSGNSIVLTDAGVYQYKKIMKDISHKEVTKTISQGSSKVEFKIVETEYTINGKVVDKMEYLTTYRNSKDKFIKEYILLTK